MADGKSKTYNEIKRGYLNMTKNEAVEYLEHILEAWNAWHEHHEKLVKAIEIVLEDVKGE